MSSTCHLIYAYAIVGKLILEIHGMHRMGVGSKKTDNQLITYKLRSRYNSDVLPTTL